MTIVPDPTEFFPVDHATWLQKVKAELKGKSISSHDYIWDNLAISPFQQFTVTSRVLPERNDNAWKIGSYGNAAGQYGNRDLLKALNEGASAIHMTIEHAPDWNILFREVHLEWIQLNLKFSHKEDLISFIQYLTQSGQQAKGSVAFSDQDQYRIYGEWHRELKEFRLLNFELNDLTNRFPLAQILFQMTRLIERLSKKYEHQQLMNSVVIHILGQTDLILNVSMIRAIRGLWRQLLISAGLEPGEYKIYILAHVKNQNSTENNFIRSSLISISMILGGIDELFIENPDLSKDHSRYGRMIQHIMDQEAYLSKVVDPLAGSKVIEHLTCLIVDRVWNEYIRIDG